MAELTAHATPAIPNLRSCLQLLALICVTSVTANIIIATKLKRPTFLCVCVYARVERSH